MSFRNMTSRYDFSTKIDEKSRKSYFLSLKVERCHRARNHGFSKSSEILRVDFASKTMDFQTLEGLYLFIELS